MFMNFSAKKTAGSLSCLLCLASLLSPSMAQAGFDWTPPPVTAPQAAPTAPVDTQASGPLTPEPDQGNSLPVPVGHVESAPVAHQEPLVVDNAEPAPQDIPQVIPAEPRPVNVAPAPATPKTEGKIVEAPVVNDDVVEGFGKDIPLAIALRDIVPAKYAYAFSPRDVAGLKISWRGGKPWQDVLKSALAPLDLDVTIGESQILISAKQIPLSAAPVAPQPAPAPVAPTPAPTEVTSAQASTDALLAAPATPSQPDNSLTTPAEPVPLVAAPASEPDAKPDMVARMPGETAKAEEASPQTAPIYKTAIDMKSVQKWQARPGTTLRKTLEIWAKDSKVELNWSTPYDYPINSAFYFEGGFAEAVQSLLSSYGGENPSPKGRLYPNLPEGPSVLMIN